MQTKNNLSAEFSTGGCGGSTRVRVEEGVDAGGGQGGVAWVKGGLRVGWGE